MQIFWLWKIVENNRSINFSAKWTPKVLTIVFHKNDGSNVTETKTYTFDWNMDDNRLNPMSNLNQRNGYNFNWWNFYANGSDNHNYPFNDIIWTTRFDTQVWNASSKTINLYAKRTPKTITITLDKQGWNGGTSTFYYKYGTNQFYSNYACTSQITSIEKPTKNEYVFIHYYGDGRHGWENGERYAKYDSTEFAWDLNYDIYEDATLYAKRDSCDNYYGWWSNWVCQSDGKLHRTRSSSHTSCTKKSEQWDACNYCSSPWTEITSRTIPDHEGCWNHWTRYGSYKKTCQNNYSYSNEQFWWWWSCACESWYHPVWDSCEKDTYCVKLRVSPWWDLSICWYEGDSYNWYSDGQGGVLRSSDYICTWNPRGTLWPASDNQVVVTCTQISNQGWGWYDEWCSVKCSTEWRWNQITTYTGACWSIVNINNICGGTCQCNSIPGDVTAIRLSKNNNPLICWCYQAWNHH